MKRFIGFALLMLCVGARAGHFKAVEDKRGYSWATSFLQALTNSRERFPITSHLASVQIKNILRAVELVISRLQERGVDYGIEALLTIAHERANSILQSRFAGLHSFVERNAQLALEEIVQAIAIIRVLNPEQAPLPLAAEASAAGSES